MTIAAISNTSANLPTSPLQPDDTSTSQQALQLLQQQAQTSKGAHRHGGGHHHADASDGDKSPSLASSTSTPNVPETSAGLLDVTT